MIVLYIICGLLQGNDLITCGILVLQGFLTNPCFANIPYATIILFIQ